MDSRHPGCKDAFGNIHVSLDSSTPYWNDTIKEALFKVTEVFSNERSPGTIL